MAKTAGQIIVKTLEQYGVDRIFCVPGESFLPILDALHDSPIQTILARHEGGAAMMAEADGKMTHRPGIALVTRGPGASNAAAGVHIAQQDSTPMMLLIGQVARDMRGRDAFQEVDYQQFYGGMAKRVFEIDDANDVPEILAEAWRIALEGRRGAVVISLPEDMLYDAVAADMRALSHAKPRIRYTRGIGRTRHADKSSGESRIDCRRFSLVGCRYCSTRTICHPCGYSRIRVVSPPEVDESSKPCLWG